MRVILTPIAIVRMPVFLVSRNALMLNMLRNGMFWLS